MKNVHILIGSPRKKGNTALMAEKLIEGLDKDLFNIKTSFLYDHTIQSCTDCRACKKGDFNCTINDDMQKLYSAIENTDLLVVGSPIYWFGPSAKTKLWLDRLRPYFGTGKLGTKRLALLLPAGTGERDCDLTIEMFKRACQALGIEYLGAVTAQAYDAGDVENDKNALSSVALLAKKANREIQ